MSAVAAKSRVISLQRTRWTRRGVRLRLQHQQVYVVCVTKLCMFKTQDIDRLWNFLSLTSVYVYRDVHSFLHVYLVTRMVGDIPTRYSGQAVEEEGNTRTTIPVRVIATTLIRACMFGVLVCAFPCALAEAVPRQALPPGREWLPPCYS